MTYLQTNCLFEEVKILLTKTKKQNTLFVVLTKFYDMSKIHSV